MRKIYLTLIIGILLISFASADLGTFKQGDVISVRGNLNTTSVNTSIYFPNGTAAVSDEGMTNLHGDIWNYNFNSTNQTGTYTYDYCDANGDNCKENIFTVTPSGNIDNLGFFIIVMLGIYGVAFIGFFGRNEWISVIGGLGMLMLGLYLISEGVVIYRDWFTNGFAYLTMGLGAFFTAVPLIEFIQKNM